MLGLLGSARFQLVLFGLLLAANESNLVIRAVFDWLDLKPRSASLTGAGVVDVGEFNRGRIIGILERALLYGFVLQAQYGAIGFILAAKAFTRFKALDDRPFAEYVLIGTLFVRVSGAGEWRDGAVAAGGLNVGSALAPTSRDRSPEAANLPLDPNAQLQFSTIFPDWPEPISSKPFWNSSTGRRCVMTGEMSMPPCTSAVILYHVSYISRP